jgi:hypothetical protein
MDWGQDQAGAVLRAIFLCRSAERSLDVASGIEQDSQWRPSHTNITITNWYYCGTGTISRLLFGSYSLLPASRSLDSYLASNR